MGSTGSPLDNLKVASPCPANWDQMYGDDRSRFCNQCRLNVYNISGMTRTDAERLLASREGRLCVRYYRRKDGTILTKDCPVGLAAVRRRIARVAGALAGFVFGVFAGTGATLALKEGADVDARYGGYERTMGTMIAEPPPPPPEFVMGDVPPPDMGRAVMGAPVAPPPASHPKAARRASAR